MKIDKLLYMAILAAAEAGKQICRVYESNQHNIVYKKDESPLTKADIESNEIINKYLQKSGLPVLSEEESNIPFSHRRDWDYFWLVDPLDGTREFLKKNDEFSVNIALVRNNQPVAGLIYSPVNQVLYFSVPGQGVFKLKSALSVVHGAKILRSIQHKSDRLPYKTERDRMVVVTSRSFQSADTEKYIMTLKNKYRNIELISTGSALKFGLIAEGTADIYPRLSPTMEWDIAAGHAILMELGFSVTDALTGNSLIYNKPELINPWFIARNSRI
jgi:3'(2'), 5'-bisphosphate nucleotidase